MEAKQHSSEQPTDHWRNNKENQSIPQNKWPWEHDNSELISSVQLLSHVWLFATPWITAHPASLSITNSQSLLKLMSIELVMPSNHLILWRLLLLPSIFPSIRAFSNESTLCIRWPKYWSFSFNISSYNEHSGLISFRMDWLDLLAVQGTLKCHLSELIGCTKSSLKMNLIAMQAYLKHQEKHWIS